MRTISLPNGQTQDTLPFGLTSDQPEDLLLCQPDMNQQLHTLLLRRQASLAISQTFCAHSHHVV